MYQPRRHLSGKGAVLKKNEAHRGGLYPFESATDLLAVLAINCAFFCCFSQTLLSVCLLASEVYFSLKEQRSRQRKSKGNFHELWNFCHKCGLYSGCRCGIYTLQCGPRDQKIVLNRIKACQCD